MAMHNTMNKQIYQQSTMTTFFWQTSTYPVWTGLRMSEKPGLDSAMELYGWLQWNLVMEWELMVMEYNLDKESK